MLVIVVMVDGCVWMVVTVDGSDSGDGGCVYVCGEWSSLQSCSPSLSIDCISLVGWPWLLEMVVSLGPPIHSNLKYLTLL